MRSRNDFLHSGQSVSFPVPLPLLLGALRGMSPGTGYISSKSNGSPLGEPWLRDELCEVTLSLRLGYGAALYCLNGDSLPPLRFPNSGDEGFEVGGGECALCQLGEPRDDEAEHGSSNCCDGEGMINEGSISAANCQSPTSGPAASSRVTTYRYRYYTPDQMGRRSVVGMGFPCSQPLSQHCFLRVHQR